jgi:hypothetical protein
MTKTFFAGLCIAFFCFQVPAKADFWGGDIPLLSQIVLNTLHTLYEMERQTSMLKDQMDGIKERVVRIKTISELVQPSSWSEWKNPEDALRRLRAIYFTLPPEYRTEKSSQIEQELSRAMNSISRIGAEANSTFQSGKELEQKAASASPGVAQKLAASGIGSLVALEAQSQVLQSHIASLLAQMLAASNEREARALVSTGSSFTDLSNSLMQIDNSFSSRALSLVGGR